MELLYKPDFEKTQQRWEALYAGEIIDRPICNIVVPKDPAHPVKPPQYMSFVHDGIDSVMDWFENYCENTWFLGDAIPGYRPEPGCDMFGAFLGAKLEYNFEGYPERWPDAWAVPVVDDWNDFFPIRVQEDNPVWQQTLHALAVAADRMDGKALIYSPDLHSNIDALVALRGSTTLLYEILDQPELMHRAMNDVRNAFFTISDKFFELARAEKWGSLRGIYGQNRTNIVAADCAALLSPALFREFVLPAIVEEAEYLDHSMFHIDGPDMVKFLDDILAIKKIDAINYVPGVQTGNKRFAEWTDFFHKVQTAGKIMEIYAVTVDEVKQLHKVLKPDQVYYNVQVSDRAEGEGLLKWLTKNS
ncbi:hypothetical protein KAH55_00625 [bacterium]|nr:hypothetical protein [bacterium]